MLNGILWVALTQDLLPVPEITEDPLWLLPVLLLLLRPNQTRDKAAQLQQITHKRSRRRRRRHRRINANINISSEIGIWIVIGICIKSHIESDVNVNININIKVFMRLLRPLIDPATPTPSTSTALIRAQPETQPQSWCCCRWLNLHLNVNPGVAAMMPHNAYNMSL